MAVKENPTHFEKVDQSTDPKYFIEFVDSRRMIEGKREIKELILSQLDLRPGAHVLDIGCGTGDDAREIAGLVSPSGRVVGIDTSEAMIAEAKRRAAGCAPSLPKMQENPLFSRLARGRGHAALRGRAASGCMATSGWSALQHAPLQSRTGLFQEPLNQAAGDTDPSRDGRQ